MDGGLSVLSGGYYVSGGLTVDTAGLKVMAGGSHVTGGMTVHTAGLTVTGKVEFTTGGLTVHRDGMVVTGGVTLNNGGLDVKGGGVRVTSGLTVNTGGLFVVGGATVTAAVSVGGGAYIANGLTVTGGFTLYGNAYQYGWTSLGFQNSDRRLKTEITPIKYALSGISRLRGVYFKWDRSVPTVVHSDERTVGFVAQEVEKMYPELVSVNEQGFKTVNYMLMIPILLEAIRELNENLENGMNEVEAELRDLREQLRR